MSGKRNTLPLSSSDWSFDPLLVPTSGVESGSIRVTVRHTGEVELKSAQLIFLQG
jgi:hypothetical protein